MRLLSLIHLSMLSSRVSKCRKAWRPVPSGRVDSNVDTCVIVTSTCEAAPVPPVAALASAAASEEVWREGHASRARLMVDRVVKDAGG